MAHKHKGGAVRSGSSGILITGGLDGLCRDGGGYGLLVLVDNGGIAANLAQQGLGNGNALKLVLILVNGLAHLVILGTVHQVGRLDNQILDTVGHSAVKRLLHIVNLLAIAGLHMVNDNLRGEGAADAPIGVRGLQGILNAFDVRGAAAVERGAEADNQQLILADVIRVAGVILGGIAGVTAKVIGVSVFALDQLLLGIGQGIPCGLGGLALGVGIVIALLHIDGVNQVCTVLRGHFVCIPFFCCCLADSLALAGGAFGNAVGGCGGATAAGQQGGGQGQGRQHGGGLLVVDSSHCVLLPFLFYGCGRGQQRPRPSRRVAIRTRK